MLWLAIFYAVASNFAIKIVREHDIIKISGYNKNIYLDTLVNASPETSDKYRQASASGRVVSQI
jgi:hypothetical protein